MRTFSRGRSTSFPIATVTVGGLLALAQQFVTPPAELAPLTPSTLNPCQNAERATKKAAKVRRGEALDLAERPTSADQSTFESRACPDYPKNQ